MGDFVVAGCQASRNFEKRADFYHGLNSIAERSLDMAKNDDSKKKNREADGGARDELVNLDGPRTEKREPEAFYYGDHGVQNKEPMPLLGIERERKQHTTRIHPKLDKKAEKHG